MASAAEFSIEQLGAATLPAGRCVRGRTGMRSRCTIPVSRYLKFLDWVEERFTTLHIARQQLAATLGGL
jgi:hypothetical protein